MPFIFPDRFEHTSIQHSASNTETYVEDYRSLSADAGRPWVVMLDEVAGGVSDTNQEQMRRQVLWPAYLSGAGGIEWYFGYEGLPLGGDLRTEDFRTREDLWRYTRVARNLMECLPVEAMGPADYLVDDPAGQVFQKPAAVYAVYLPNGGSHTLDLSDAPGTYSLRWLDPATGVLSGPASFGGVDVVSLGEPAFGGDVVAVVDRVGDGIDVAQCLMP